MARLGGRVVLGAEVPPDVARRQEVPLHQPSDSPAHRRRSRARGRRRRRARGDGARGRIVREARRRGRGGTTPGRTSPFGCRSDRTADCSRRPSAATGTPNSAPRMLERFVGRQSEPRGVLRERVDADEARGHVVNDVAALPVEPRATHRNAESPPGLLRIERVLGARLARAKRARDEQHRHAPARLASPARCPGRRPRCSAAGRSGPWIVPAGRTDRPDAPGASRSAPGSTITTKRVAGSNDVSASRRRRSACGMEPGVGDSCSRIVSSGTPAPAGAIVRPVVRGSERHSRAMPPVRKTVEEVDRESERLERPAIEAERRGQLGGNGDEVMAGEARRTSSRQRIEQIGVREQFLRRAGADCGSQRPELRDRGCRRHGDALALYSAAGHACVCVPAADRH